MVALGGGSCCGSRVRDWGRASRPRKRGVRGPCTPLSAERSPLAQRSPQPDTARAADGVEFSFTVGLAAGGSVPWLRAPRFHLCETPGTVAAPDPCTQGSTASPSTPRVTRACLGFRSRRLLGCNLRFHLPGLGSREGQSGAVLSRGKGEFAEPLAPADQPHRGCSVALNLSKVVRYPGSQVSTPQRGVAFLPSIKGITKGSNSRPRKG